MEYKDANLLVLQSLSKMFKLPVGFSDHSLGTILSGAAVALGATVLESILPFREH